MICVESVFGVEYLTLYYIKKKYNRKSKLTFFFLKHFQSGRKLMALFYYIGFAATETENMW